MLLASDWRCVAAWPGLILFLRQTRPVRVIAGHADHKCQLPELTLYMYTTGDGHLHYFIDPD